MRTNLASFAVSIHCSGRTPESMSLGTLSGLPARSARLSIACPHCEKRIKVLRLTAAEGRTREERRCPRCSCSWVSGVPLWVESGLVARLLHSGAREQSWEHYHLAL